jgi:hypothetical protein
MVPPGEHAPPEATALREPVQPCNRVVVPRVLGLEPGEDVLEASDALGPDADEGRLDGAELELHFRDDPGEAHPAGGGEEQPAGGFVGILRAHPAHTGGRDERERADEPPERPVVVVVLAVHVGRDGAAQRHEARARGHGQEVAVREQRAQHAVERAPGSRPQRRALRVELERPGQLVELEDRAARALCRVAIAAAEAPRKHAPTRSVGTGAGGEEVCEVPERIGSAEADPARDARGRPAEAREHRGLAGVDGVRAQGGRLAELPASEEAAGAAVAAGAARSDGRHLPRLPHGL